MLLICVHHDFQSIGLQVVIELVAPYEVAEEYAPCGH
jgi:hypothetical protein